MRARKSTPSATSASAPTRAAFINALTGGPAGLVTGLEQLQAASGVPGIVPGATYFGAGQGISDAYRMTNTSASIFGQLDYTDRQAHDHRRRAYLHDRKKAASNVVLNDRFSLLNLENVPNLGLIPFAALPASLSGCLLQKGFNPASRPFRPASLVRFAGSAGQPVRRIARCVAARRLARHRAPASAPEPTRSH